MATWNPVVLGEFSWNLSSKPENADVLVLRNHVSSVNPFVKRKFGLSGIAMRLVVPLKRNACPIIPGPNSVPPSNAPSLVETLSVALLSLRHQPTKLGGAGRQRGGLLWLKRILSMAMSSFKPPRLRASTRMV